MSLVRRTFAAVAKRQFSAVPAGSYLSVEEVTTRVLDVAKSMKHCPTNVLSANSHFASDLGFDSLLRMDLNKRLAAEFCVKIEPKLLDTFVSIDAAVNYFSTHPKAR